MITQFDMGNMQYEARWVVKFVLFPHFIWTNPVTEDMSDKFRMFDILDVDMGGRAGGRESQTLKGFFFKATF